ncbi:MAG: acyl-CoA thioesterase [Candidatus Eisenbacteria bacterium]
MPREEFRLNHVIVPRFRDTDAMGHINNAVYITYLEVGRQAYWARLIGRDDYRSVPFILASVTCDFRSEALVDETLEVGLACEWIGNKSFGFRYEIRSHEGGRVVVEARTVQVCYDYAAKRSIPVPAGLRERLESFEGRALARDR